MNIRSIYIYNRVKHFSQLPQSQEVLKLWDQRKIKLLINLVGICLQLVGHKYCTFSLFGAESNLC